jgi:hypothetical protein
VSSLIGIPSFFCVCGLQLFQLFQKFLLCLVLIALNPYNGGRDALMPQSVIFLVIISGPVFLNLFFRTYRCPSSNYLKAIFDGSAST